MSKATEDRVSPYLEAIKNLSPLIAQHRQSSDRDRHINQNVYNKLADAGLFRLWLPKSLGGPELSPIEFLTVVEAIAALDGAVGWLVGNGGGMSRAGGYLPETTARKLFADTQAFVASSTAAVGKALSEDGGFRITGKWYFASGATPFGPSACRRSIARSRNGFRRCAQVPAALVHPAHDHLCGRKRPLTPEPLTDKPRWSALNLEGVVFP